VVTDKISAQEREISKQQQEIFKLMDQTVQLECKIKVPEKGKACRTLMYRLEDDFGKCGLAYFYI